MMKRVNVWHWLPLSVEEVDLKRVAMPRELSGSWCLFGQWRSPDLPERRGPPFRKFGEAVRYAFADVAEWAKNQTPSGRGDPLAEALGGKRSRAERSKHAEPSAQCDSGRSGVKRKTPSSTKSPVRRKAPTKASARTSGGNRIMLRLKKEF